MKTKFTILFILITISAVLLTGCSNASTSTVSASDGLSSAAKLPLGTLKLEGTNQAVTTAQSTELLTLWQGYESLSTSDTASQVELDALVNQIQGGMATEQIKAIDAMDLTDQSMNETLSRMGNSDIGKSPASTPSASAMSQAGPAGGNGDSVMSVIACGMTAQSTPIATPDANTAVTTQVNPMLLNALIQILVSRSQMAGWLELGLVLEFFTQQLWMDMTAV